MDLLGGEYNSSSKKSYYALSIQVRDINVSFELSIEEARKSMLDVEYKAKITSWRNKQSYYFDLSPVAKDEHKMTPMELLWPMRLLL